jgi:elongation factor P--beta-lysine ligase
MKKLIDSIRERVFKTTGEKIQQTQRNNLKTEILQAIQEHMPQDIVIGRAKEGIILEFPNDELGAIAVVLDIKIKDLEFDVTVPIQELENSIKEKEEKEIQKKKKIARDKEKRQKEKEEKEKLKEEKGE